MHPIPRSTNRLLFALFLALHLLVLAVLPALNAPPQLWLPLLLLMLWLSIVHWGLIHEAIHKLLFPSPRANEVGGRVLSILMGTSFHVLRFGHLMHHKLNRQFHAETVARDSLAARIHYYAHLLLGTYATEIIAGWLMALLPRDRFMRLVRQTLLRHDPEVAHTGERFFYERGNAAKTRTDAALATLLYALALYAAGPQWIWILAFITCRAMVISFMDNIYHYATPLDNSKAGKELALPPLVSTLLLHGNYHETHHTNPNVPWSALPAVHAAQNRRFDGGFVEHGLMQFDGPPVMAS